MARVAPALALSFYYFAYFAYVGAYSPYITLYLKDLGLAATQIGILYAIPQVMRIFGPNAWGALADRSGEPVLILRLAALAALGCFCLLYADTSFAWIFGVLVAVHFFTSAQMPVVEALTLDIVRDAPGRYGRIRVWGSVSFILAVLGLGALLDHAPARAVLHVVAGLLALTVVASLLVGRSAHRGARRAGSPVGAVLRRAEVRAFLAAGALNAFAHAALYTFYSLHLADHGYSKSAIGMMWATGVVIEIAVFHFMPQIMTRFDAGRLFRWTFVVCVARFLIIAWCVGSWWLLVLAQLMHAATFAVYHASAVSLVARHFGAANQARGQAIYISISFGLGGFAGGVSAGLLWEGVGPEWTYTASALAGALGAALLWGAGQRDQPASR